MYAIVKVKTDAGNRITGYSFINQPAEGVKQGFKFLTGYQFPKTMPINGRPIVFYLGIDNLNICKEKPGDRVYYAPNRVVEVITGHIQNILKENPRTIIIPNMVMVKYGASQE